MPIRSLIATFLLLASLAAPVRAERLASVSLTEAYGPMTARYLRQLEGLERENLDQLDLGVWRARMLKLRNLKDVHFTRSGKGLEVTLQEQPYLQVIPKFIPFVLPVGLEVIAEDWKLAGQYFDVKAWAGYVWSGVTLYEPDHAEARARGSLNYNFPEAYARLGLMVLPYTRIYLEGKAAGAGMEGEPLHAAGFGTVHGAMFTLSPFIRYDDTDQPDLPQKGKRARLGVLFGPKGWGNPGDHLRYDAAYQHYFPLGAHDSLAIGIHGGLAEGELPLAHAYWLGAGNYLRGYSGTRFVGNQMLALSVELRHALWRDVLGTGVTLWSTGFVDAARSWNRGAAIAFPQDIRPAIGGYLGLSHGTWFIGRLEAAVGNEGPFVNIAAGLPFPW